MWRDNATPRLERSAIVGNVRINHLMYADDLVIISQFVAGLSKTLSIIILNVLERRNIK